MKIDQFQSQINNISKQKSSNDNNKDLFKDLAILCLNNNPGKFYCLDCIQYPVTCSVNDCSCHKSHQDCEYFQKVLTMHKKLNSKLYPKINCNQITQFTDKMKELVSQLEEQLIQEYQYFGLNKSERKIVKLIQDLAFNKKVQGKDFDNFRSQRQEKDSNLFTDSMDIFTCIQNKVRAKIQYLFQGLSQSIGSEHIKYSDNYDFSKINSLIVNQYYQMPTPTLQNIQKSQKQQVPRVIIFKKRQTNDTNQQKTSTNIIQNSNKSSTNQPGTLSNIQLFNTFFGINQCNPNEKNNTNIFKTKTSHIMPNLFSSNGHKQQSDKPKVNLFSQSNTSQKPNIFCQPQKGFTNLSVNQPIWINSNNRKSAIVQVYFCEILEQFQSILIALIQFDKKKKIILIVNFFYIGTFNFSIKYDEFFNIHQNETDPIPIQILTADFLGSLVILLVIQYLVLEELKAQRKSKKQRMRKFHNRLLMILKHKLNKAKIQNQIKSNGPERSIKKFDILNFNEFVNF